MEDKKRRTFSVKRYYNRGTGFFQYYYEYSDGTVEKCNRRQADQFIKAYGGDVETLTKEPNWNINTTGN